jgi:ribosomal protein S14
VKKASSETAEGGGAAHYTSSGHARRGGALRRELQAWWPICTDANMENLVAHLHRRKGQPKIDFHKCTCHGRHRALVSFFYLSRVQKFPQFPARFRLPPDRPASAPSVLAISSGW